MKRARYQWEHTGITKPGVFEIKNIYQAQLVDGALGAFKFEREHSHYDLLSSSLLTATRVSHFLGHQIVSLRQSWPRRGNWLCWSSISGDEMYQIFLNCRKCCTSCEPLNRDRQVVTRSVRPLSALQVCAVPLPPRQLQCLRQD